ncbi:uncharacterized protein LOC127389491 isoform X1 [Apus apus]|uniref:uncharacterized protein LOC127389491 isoform X1 n=1 Tax=Apus apus TaxID=8895 RepID=UPI0021F8B978|nr:uncharacterized protein LOC127389491 isoform X1 [Apus apus]
MMGGPGAPRRGGSAEETLACRGLHWPPCPASGHRRLFLQQGKLLRKSQWSRTGCTKQPWPALPPVLRKLPRLQPCGAETDSWLMMLIVSLSLNRGIRQLQQRPWDHGPEDAGWVGPKGPATEARLDGVASWGSGWGAIPLPGELSLQGAALPIGMEKGRQPCALDGSPVGSLESHHSLAVLLPIPGTLQHPCPWWHSTLPAARTFPTLSICPMIRVLLPSQAGTPVHAHTACCVLQLQDTGHGLAGIMGPPYWAAVGAMLCLVQGLKHSAYLAGQHVLVVLQEPLGDQGTAPHAAPAQPPACPPGLGASALALLPGGNSGPMPGFHGNSR